MSNRVKAVIGLLLYLQLNSIAYGMVFSGWAYDHVVAVLTVFMAGQVPAVYIMYLVLSTEKRR